MTREEWLNTLTAELKPLFAEQGYDIPAVRIACGWPSKKALSRKSRSIGECWPIEASADKTTEIFISPCQSDAVEVGAVLVHELVHAAVGCKAGHKAPFKRCALAVGLEGKMTATVAGEALRERLNALTEKMGAYLHAVLDMSVRKKQGTRMHKVECPECGYTVRITQQWIDQGLPTCPCGCEMIEG